jgi:subfamily B ATP-binding cassette protein MsbA
LLIVFLFILVRLTEPLRSINAIRHELTAEIPSLIKIDQVILKAKNAQHIKNGNIPFQSIQSTLDFDDVSFSYRDNCPVLKNISLTILKNEMIAFVGMSGGGKSTIIDLLLRIIEPTTGRILINKIELNQYEIKSYHEKVGVVSQDTFIFNDSVLNNICYGVNKIDRDLAVESAKIANAHEFIIALPQGYETTLGDRGVQISGGEKQRIAIARAIYRNPEILVFDEATSALDSESEKTIQQAINNLRSKYTMIMVAHRLSTVVNADRLYVIENGEIIEHGTHQQLLDKKTRYASYYQIQYGSSNGNTSDLI